MSDGSGTPATTHFDAPIVIEYQLTKSQAVQAVRQRAFRKPGFWVANVVLLFVVAVSLIRSANQNTSGRWLYLAWAVFLVVSLPLMFTIIPRLRHRDPNRKGPQRLEVTEGGFRVQRVSTDQIIQWAAVREVIETTDYYFLRPLGRVSGYFIPRSAFSTSADEERFRRIMTKYPTARLLNGGARE
jgi:hypothetical protein